MTATPTRFSSATRRAARLGLALLLTGVFLVAGSGTAWAPTTSDTREIVIQTMTGGVDAGALQASLSISTDAPRQEIVLDESDGRASDESLRHMRVFDFSGTLLGEVTVSLEAEVDDRSR